MTAVARALHREEPPPWALDDDLAGVLAGDQGTAIRELLAANFSPESLLAFTRWVCVRARYPEDLVERAVATGTAKQYVILGAGLDTFAYRRRDLATGLKVFEVDHPASQAWKRARLEAVDVVVPDNLAYRGCRLRASDASRGPRAGSVRFDQPTIISWLGVTMYLTAEAIDATLSTLRGFHPGSRLVLTYNLPPAALSGLGSSTDATLAGIAADMGEPFVSLFRPDEIEDVLRRHGYIDIEHFGPDEALATYFAGRHDVHFGGAQRIVAASTPGASRVRELGLAA